MKRNLILSVAGGITLMILLSLMQEMGRRWQVQKEVRILEEQVGQLEHNVIELEHVNQYFRTDDYQERLAREKLNFRAEGESVVLIPEEELQAQENQKTSEQEKPEPNPLKWWKLFFVDEVPLS